MIWDSKSPQEVVKYLNELLHIDREALTNLIEHRVDCNEALMDHPTVQVRCYPTKTNPSGEPKVGLLGILNGLFGTDSRGYASIVGVYDDDPIKPQLLYFTFRVSTSL